MNPTNGVRKLNERFLTRLRSLPIKIRVPQRLPPIPRQPRITTINDQQSQNETDTPINGAEDTFTTIWVWINEQGIEPLKKILHSYPRILKMFHLLFYLFGASSPFINTMFQSMNAFYEIIHAIYLFFDLTPPDTTSMDLQQPYQHHQYNNVGYNPSMYAQPNYGQSYSTMNQPMQRLGGFSNPMY
mmetsp:Transcript_6815/g.9941  ORF Transcript_6815/g.9941 Transcript_6815/m.9941 type:complete len:186 (-) Transcript_6815:20-577(-)